MKRTFLAKRNALLSVRSVSWGVLVLAFAMLMLILRLSAPNLFLHIVTPVFRVSDAIATESNSFFAGFGDATERAKQNEELLRANASLVHENKVLLQKVEDLTRLFGSPASRKTAGIIAGVVSRPPTSPYDTLVLAKGAGDGVALGMEAFGEGGVPVGVVSSVFADFSRVTLFSSPGVTTDGWVGDAHTALTIQGAGAGVMQSFVSRSSTIMVGDTVFVPGPGMLPVGNVVKIEQDELSPGVTLRIMPALNIFSIPWVELRVTGTVPSSFATSTAL